MQCRAGGTRSRGFIRPLTAARESTLKSDMKAPNRAIRKAAPIDAGERRLIALAAALTGDVSKLSAAESRLAASAGAVDPRAVDPHAMAEARMQIRAGCDPLGAAFCRIRSAGQRRRLGATYTPATIVDAMAAWAHAENPRPARIVDPGAGSGRFLMAAARRFPDAELIAVEADPLAMLMLRANAAVNGFADRLTVHLTDYRTITLPAASGPTLFIGNPPYVRHHDIGEQWKIWFAATAGRFGLRASKLAGLHIHFFFKTRELARPGDYGAFITAAEWLDVNYGSALRRLLGDGSLDGLGGTAVHIIDPGAQPFTDALTTAAITCFRVGSRPAGIVMRAVDSLDDLSPDNPAPRTRERAVAGDEIAAARKWSIFVREPQQAPAGFIELGEMFRVHRGQVTGSNAVWIESGAARDLPKRCKPHAVTRARELFAAGAALTSARGFQRVIDLPADLDTLDAGERKAVQRFLAWAMRQGAHESYIATHRRAWWSVGLRAPAPVLCTYMARRAPAFVRNLVRVRHINIAHGLYPREPLDDAALAAVVAWLRHHASTAGGRTYAGGLVKFEPKELERILLPPMEEMRRYVAERDA